MVNKNQYIILGFGSILLQFLLAGPLTVNLVRPDFILIFILYISIWEGRMWGVIIAFFLGLLVDLSGVGSFFGLTSLTYTVFAYLTGNLNGQYNKLSPIVFNLFWSLMLIVFFLIQHLVTSQFLLAQNPQIFWVKVFMSALYTFLFTFIINFFIPIGNEQ